ncbi:hypothetical protein KXD93_29575 [Mucilaginibacter sp. BJC16-A38]|uniref:hypothetical protein n=1 Tax=Mucilaginibacter phenanthrenivorans TaxID=1234842 RepID=UPI00215745BB|nr:hypothetical protein [Mucilaginibacter phenanthrenivorans]MCR8561842.1 hypothetical protein [Mucilaginibacter phenanthrenivorans]
MKSTLFKSLLLILFIPVCLKAQIKLEKKGFLDNKIELSVPADFKPMSAEMLDKKYPNRNQKPNLVLTDEDAEVNIVISLIPQPIKPEQIGAFKDFQINSLKKMHPDAKWMNDGVRAINGKNVGYFKFISNAVDQTVFNYYFFTDLDGKVLLLSFNCTEKLLPKWKETAESIVSSLKVTAN